MDSRIPESLRDATVISDTITEESRKRIARRHFSYKLPPWKTLSKQSEVQLLTEQISPDMCHPRKMVR